MIARAGDPVGAVSATATLGELVAQRPARAELFERLRLDYCCGGAKTLDEACQERGLDPHSIRRLILSEDAAPGLPAAAERRDWRRASVTALCEHIVEVHHESLRRELPQIGELIASVVRVHGPVHPELDELPRAFGALRDELEPHLELEEQLLFPACRALESGNAEASVDDALLGALEHDHHEVGDALAKLRRLTDDYDPAGAMCRTHHRLLVALRALELDLHQHVHEENNILLPRVRSILAPRHQHSTVKGRAQDRQLSEDYGGGDDLPACCQGWLAEQTHRGISTAAEGPWSPDADLSRER